jgi:ABC-type glutathione transport system ATPase component
MGLIFISHDLRLVSTFCDRVLVMYAGKVVEEMLPAPTGRRQAPLHARPAQLPAALATTATAADAGPPAGVGPVNVAATRTPTADVVDGLSPCVVYDGFVAVDDTSLRVAAGESFGIVGESGSGKSTVLRALCGLAPRPRQASHWSANGGQQGARRARAARPFRRLVQMVFQDPYGSLHPRQTVDRILAEPLAIHGIGDAEAASSARWTRSAWATASASAIRTSSPAASASASRSPAR